MRKLAGIEIDESIASVILLTDSSNVIEIERFNRFNITSDEGFSSFLDHLREYAAGSHIISLSFSASFFHTRVLDLPIKSKDKISEIIDLELEDHLAEHNSVVKSIFKKTSEEKTLTFSMPERTEGLIDRIKDSGINLDFVTVSGIAFVEKKFIEKGFTDSLFIHVVENRVTFFVTDKTGVSYVKGIMGKSDSIGLFENRLILEYKFLKNSVSGIKSNGNFPENIIISGHSNTIQGVDKIIKNCIEEDSAVFHGSAEDDRSDETALSLAVYHKMSKEPLNFSKRRNPFRLLFTENKRALKAPLILLSFLLLFIFFNSVSELYRLKRVDNMYSEKMGEVYRRSFPESKKSSNFYEFMDSKVKGLKKNNPTIDINVKKVDILNTVSSALPENIDVVVTKITIGKGILVLSGHTDSFITVDSIKKRLEGLKIFESVEMGSPSKSRRNRVNFRLNIKIKGV